MGSIYRGRRKNIEIPLYNKIGLLSSPVFPMEERVSARVHFHHEMKDRLRAFFSFHEGKKQGIEAMEWVRNSGSVKNIEVVDTKKMTRCLRAILIYFLESEKVKSN